MAFQTPITIKRALSAIRGREYVLPAIQREMVWRPRQIERLFDSLMRGYPIGSFLFWEVLPDNIDHYQFYNFITHYDIRKPHNTPIGRSPERNRITAVLDGQQRLTALNIGLCGSHTSKLPRQRWTNPKAFPEKWLHLNLLGAPEESDEGMAYEFRFLSKEEAERGNRKSDTYWYLVGDVLGIRDRNDDLLDFVQERGLAKASQGTLARLHEMVHSKGVIAFYEEESQDLHKVLNIFVRTNSGGTVLSYSDMLLSVATAKWKGDARAEIHGFVDEINRTGRGFSFTKDFVLKACLMLSDLDIKFQVTNFTAKNMNLIEAQWERIKRSVRTAVGIAADTGYDSGTLSAANSLLPIAYYLHRRERPESWLTSGFWRKDRDRVRGWLTRALLKRGVWGSGLDSLLGGVRRVIREGTGEFPIVSLEDYMAPRGKSLSFDDAELEDLVDVRYGDGRAYGVLRLLYPFVDVANKQFHIDHIFPQSKLRRSPLARAGIAESAITGFTDRVNGLANLQLLPGPENQAKKDKLPTEWLRENLTDGAMREHDLEGLPENITDFPAFYDRRRQRMLERLQSLLSSRAS